MSNEFKMVPVEPTEEMLNVMHDRVVISVNTRKQEANIINDKAWWAAVVAAAPQPPALGGEPEVINQYLSKGECARWHSLCESQLIEATQQGFVTRQLIDRAHLAPLQAEIELLKTCIKNNALAAGELVGSLRSELDQLNARRDERAEFETWHEARYPLHSMLLNFDEERGEYAYPSRREMFDVWQARAALSKPAGSRTDGQ